jgi:hypothetical protein
MPAVRLTDVSIRAFKAPAKGQCTYWDRALGLRVSQGGSKTFVVLAGSGKRRALGRYPDLSLAEARKKAKLYVANPTDISFKDASDLFVKVRFLWVYRQARRKMQNDQARALGRRN